MRDGNHNQYFQANPHIKVVSLPMRDGNIRKCYNHKQEDLVVSLPMRDGNRGANRL